MKILVAIANYGTSQLNYLERVVYEYTHLKNHEADVYIHTNVPVRDGDILSHPNVHEVFISEGDVNGDWQRLPFTTRKTLTNGFPDYDLYIYSENDILIEEHNIDAFVEASDVIKSMDLMFIPGFIRFEVNGNKMTFPEAHRQYRWNPEYYFADGDMEFMRFSCDHYGAFMLTAEQMSWVRQNNPSFDTEEYVEGYEERTFKVKHCTSIYKNYGWIQVIPVSHIDKFLIHHLSDRYKVKYGHRDLIMELKEAKKYAGVDMPYVKYCYPYSYNKNVGDAYNREFETVGDGDWVCLTDADAMFLTPDYGHQIGYTITQCNKIYDNYILTCYTNRVGCKFQRHPQVGLFDEKDLTKHRILANTLHKKNFAKVTELEAPISGMCMIIPKKIWDEIKFENEGILGVDHKFSNTVLERGYKILRMDGLYILHYYRMNEGRKFTGHLI